MDRDILETMQEKMQSFSKGQRRIAQYIVASCDKAAFMTASNLGKTVGVSESTVVRFAVDLGFDGYPALQKTLQGLVLDRLTAGQRIEGDNDQVNRQDLLSKAIHSDMDRLRRAGETVDRGVFQSAVDAIAGAKRVYVMGVHTASPVAHFLGNDLSSMIPNVRTVTASGATELFEQILDVNREDVVILLSFRRHSSGVMTAAEHCRSNGATVVAITDRPESELAKSSNHVIWVQTGKNGAVDSLVAPMCVISALVTAVASVREQERRRNLETLERLLNQYHLYEKRDEEK